VSGIDVGCYPDVKLTGKELFWDSSGRTGASFGWSSEKTPLWRVSNTGMGRLYGRGCGGESALEGAECTL
jgi:hypothetical protein